MPLLYASMSNRTVKNRTVSEPPPPHFGVFSVLHLSVEVIYTTDGQSGVTGKLRFHANVRSNRSLGTAPSRVGSRACSVRLRSSDHKAVNVNTCADEMLPTSRSICNFTDASIFDSPGGTAYSTCGCRKPGVRGQGSGVMAHGSGVEG